MHKFGLSSITTSHISKNTRKTIHPVCIYIIITLCWLKKKFKEDKTISTFIEFLQFIFSLSIIEISTFKQSTTCRHVPILLKSFSLLQWFSAKSILWMCVIVLLHIHLKKEQKEETQLTRHISDVACSPVHI